MNQLEEKTLRDGWKVFCDVFSGGIPLESFSRKHQDNPCKVPGFSTLVAYENGIPCGTNSFMGHMIVADGEHCLAAESCDTAVMPESRGRGMFSSLIRQALSLCREKNIAFLFGFPNQNSYPGFQKLGFQTVGVYKTYFLIHHPLFLLADLVLKRRESVPFRESFFIDRNGDAWSLCLRCPFTDEDIAAVNQRPGIYVERSRAYFQYKIDHFPEGQSAYLLCRRNGKLLSYFVLRQKDRRSYLYDWMLPEDRPSEAVKEMFRILRNYSNITIIYMMNPCSDEFSAFAKSGFLIAHKSANPLIVFITSDSVPRALRQSLQDFNQWYFRFLDGDTVLHD